MIGRQTRVKVVKNKVAHLSAKPNSTSCLVKAFRGPAKSSIWEPTWASSKKAVHGTATTTPNWGQGRDAAKQCIADNPELEKSWKHLCLTSSKTTKINSSGQNRHKKGRHVKTGNTPLHTCRPSSFQKNADSRLN